MKLLLAVGCLWLGFGAYRLYRSGRVELPFARQGATVPDLQLTFYPDQLAFAAPSPPPALGQVRVAAAASIDLGADLVPGRAVVRYEGPGVGTGFAFVELGQERPAIVLREPVSLRGRIGEPQGLWCYGWRCAGFVPVADAEVVAMGGGEHGVPLASTRTDEQGRFELHGIDGGLTSVGLRVRARGFALAAQEVPLAEATVPLVVPMARAAPLLGSIRGPAGFDPTGITVLARGLPGIQAVPNAAGEFVLEHLPSDTEPRLLLHGLPAGLAQVPARAVRGATLAIEVVPAARVRGQVLDGATRVPMGGVLVFCGDGAAVRADASGNFELPRLLPGDVEIVAQWQSANRRKRTVVRTGSRRVQLAAGQQLDDLVVTID